MRTLVLCLGLVGALLGATPGPAEAGDQRSGPVHLRFPVAGESPGIPAYARIHAAGGNSPGVATDGEWAAIPFYRLVSCVPADFNLLEFFNIPRAFSCPMTVEGHEIWENGPGVDPAPFQVVTKESEAVPTWFVSWSELQPAMADGSLTITELAGLPSLLVGSATLYREVLHPGEMISIKARGTLSDGRPFSLQALCRCAKQDPVVHITIG